MDQMKGRRDPQLHFTWVEQWAQGRASEDLDTREREVMTSSRVLVAVNNIHMVVSKNSCVPFFTSPYSFAWSAKLFKVLSFGVCLVCSYIHQGML